MGTLTAVAIYEELQTLRDDPEAFACRAKAILEEYFSSLPADQAKRARQFQWRLDNDLRHYKDPVARMNKMLELFWAGVRDLRDVLDNSTEFKAKTQNGGEVVQLKR